MKLSVIIVNYNVAYFLEQCLLTVQRACAGIEAEVIVVDNASVDNSVQMVKSKFPAVKLIENKTNEGFSKANNKGINLTSGEYVLLLNPDTVVAEDTFTSCIHFMDNHPSAGALGVRMVDGRGCFLPESKRGLPTPTVAFYKMFGLSKLFPNSPTFNRYHLGYLSEHETHEVEILSGAFMFMRKEALEKSGLLDEAFFMYGEDIDLSYRIIKAGYKNYYLADTTIVHYKGESTKKGSLNYVKVFYEAMGIFARKHFSGNSTWAFSLLIQVAIVFRALLTLLGSLLSSSFLFLVDAVVAYAGLFYITHYWETMIKYREHYYPEQFLLLVVPAYIFCWLIASFFSGAYDKPFRLQAILRGIVSGTIIIAVLYAFLPEDWRFSRAIILLGAIWTGIALLISRTVYRVAKNQSLFYNEGEVKQCLVIGTVDVGRAEKILRSLYAGIEVNTVSDITQTSKAAHIYNAEEVVFCSNDFSYKDIIAQTGSASKYATYKILNPDSDALIGSNSKNTAGDLYVAEKTYRLYKPENRRNKRVWDMAFCVLCVVLLPYLLMRVKSSGTFFKNWWTVLTGAKSWVGFKTTNPFNQKAILGVLHPAVQLKNWPLTATDVAEIELNYARHYTVLYDIKTVLSNVSSLGNT